MPAEQQQESPLMTRERLHEYLNNDLGIPVGKSTLVKLCAPACGEGPPIAAWWGKRPLYRRADAKAWAERRLRKSA
jgi:hypothetical protein